MDTFSIIRDALASTEDDPNKVGLDEYTIMVGRVLHAVQVVVDALTPPDGGKYAVGFKDINTAGTSLADRTITVSSKPLRDRSLTLTEKAVVIATFAAHEIGHTFVTRPRKFPVNLVREHNDHTGFHSVANIADDIILEPFMVDRFPILADAFEFTGRWVLTTTHGDTLPVTDTLDRSTTAAERFNHMLHATRYGDIPEIIWTPGKMEYERDWYRDWAARLLAAPVRDHARFLSLCDEVWERIREIDPEPEPEPPITDDPEPTDEDGEDGEDGEDEGEDEPEPGDETEPPGPVCGPTGPTGETEEEPQGDDFDEDRPEDEDDEPSDQTTDKPGDKPDEDGDEDGESDDDGGDDATDDGDTESDDGDDDGDEDGEDGDEGDEPTNRPDPTGHEGTAPDAKDSTEDGGGGDAEADKDTVRDEDDFDTTEVEKTAHDEAEQTSYDGDAVEGALRTYASTTVTMFGRHGSLPTTWD